MRDTLEAFRHHFFAWVVAHNRPNKRFPSGFDIQPESLFAELQAKIPTDLLSLIGAAIKDGWLATANDGRGYFIQETAAGSPPQPTVYHAGAGKVIPWWELYIQLADYARLRQLAERRGLVVRMEDRQMDITVWAGEQMLLYVENKVTAESAKHLLKKMRDYGERGFELTDENKDNDPLRKAMYLFQDNSRPPYVAISALDYRQLFKVEYGDDNHRFQLIDLPGDLTSPLLHVESRSMPPPRTPADLLAVEVQRLAHEDNVPIWLSPGTGATAFNALFRLPSSGKDAIVIAAYKDGRMWSALKEIGPELGQRLSSNLSDLGISRDSDEYPFWKKQGLAMRITAADAPAIAEAVVDAVYPRDPGQTRSI
jgi:hypothetical protein